MIPTVAERAADHDLVTEIDRSFVALSELRTAGRWPSELNASSMFDSDESLMETMAFREIDLHADKVRSRSLLTSEASVGSNAKEYDMGTLIGPMTA